MRGEEGGEMAEKEEEKEVVEEKDDRGYLL